MLEDGKTEAHWAYCGNGNCKGSGRIVKLFVGRPIPLDGISQCMLCGKGLWYSGIDLPDGVVYVIEEREVCDLGRCDP